MLNKQLSKLQKIAYYKKLLIVEVEIRELISTLEKINELTKDLARHYHSLEVQDRKQRIAIIQSYANQLKNTERINALLAEQDLTHYELDRCITAIHDYLKIGTVERLKRILRIIDYSGQIKKSDKYDFLTDN